MVQKINVYYEGWGDKFHWATLGAADARSSIIFEYTDEAFAKGLELSPYLFPLVKGRDFSKSLPRHQLGLPGPVYDSLPDGWGLLLMDKLFQKRGLDPARLSALDRLAYVGDSALGAMTFAPADSFMKQPQADIPMAMLAQEVQQVLEDKDTALLAQLALVGGSPHGARPKALVYLNSETHRASTVPMEGAEPWLVKFPAMNEHSEVCAIEDLYIKSASACGLEAPPTVSLDLGQGLSAFGIKRFDREGKYRVPVHTLAAFVGADFRVAGSIGYITLIQATRFLTRDSREVKKAFERAVFNVIFNNRDDHGKNFSFRMGKDGHWKLAPVYDITFNRGPGGYHQMDVAGEASIIRLAHLQQLGKEAGVSKKETIEIISRVAQEASLFSARVQEYDGAIRRQTEQSISRILQANIKAATS